MLQLPNRKMSEKMAEYRLKCERVVRFLETGKYPTGMPKKDKRTIRNNAKNHIWDSQSKCL